MVEIDRYFYDTGLLSGTGQVENRLFFDNASAAQAGPEKKLSAAACDALDEQSVVSLAGYVFSYYFAWTPEQAAELLNEEILSRTGLLDAVRLRVQYPPEIRAGYGRYLSYFLSLVYPGKLPYDMTEAVISCYRDILQGGKVPAGLFDRSEEGRKRASLCLLFLLKNAGKETIPEMYDHLSGRGAQRFLRDGKLLCHCEENYRDPAEFLRQSLPENAVSEECFQKAEAVISGRKTRSILRKAQMAEKVTEQEAERPV